MAEFTLCLSHDVDHTHKTFQYATHAWRCLRTGNLQGGAYHLRSIAMKNPYWQFERIMEIERSYGIRSTFFFLNESMSFRPLKCKTWPLSLGYYDIQKEEIKSMIRYLDKNGWEVGLHGSYLSYKDFDLLLQEKSLLETILGHRVEGVRQHFLQWTKDTWKNQQKAGFLYDSTFGYRDRIGFRNECYSLFTPAGLPGFYVVPLAIMDKNIMGQSDPLASVTNLADIARANHACLVVNWHQRVFNEQEFPMYSSIYQKIIEACLQREAQCMTIGRYVAENRHQAAHYTS